jgi:transcriptional regulator with XRE-family HTH domain
LAHRRKTFPSEELAAVVGVIADVRERQGISQRELSRRLDFHEMTIMRLENGKRDLTLGEFIAIAAELGEDPADLLSRALKP